MITGRSEARGTFATKRIYSLTDDGRALSWRGGSRNSLRCRAKETPPT